MMRPALSDTDRRPDGEGLGQLPAELGAVLLPEQ